MSDGFGSRTWLADGQEKLLQAEAGQVSVAQAVASGQCPT
jgi:hypothetical protein